MGFWFFLTAVVVGRMILKAYKMQVSAQSQKIPHDKIRALELELKAIREKIQHLDEAVFFEDFELKKQFHNLQKETAKNGN